jgi:hypothetical protein
MDHFQEQITRRVDPFSKNSIKPVVLNALTELSSVGSVLLIGFALLVWGYSLRNVDISRITDLGMVSVLHPLTYVALAILLVGFSLALCSKQPRGLILLLYVFALIFMLYGLPNIVQEVPRIHVTWRHVGIIDHIIQNGSVDPTIDAYFNWPGFFILGAFFTEILGLKSALDLASWAPVFLNLIYLGPLMLIFSAATDDRRFQWLGVWFFYLTNWIGQDYLSPQGFNYFLFMMILGILLKWLKTTPLQPDLFYERWVKASPIAPLIQRARLYFASENLLDQPSRPGQRIGLILIVILLFIVIVAGHQLTPFAVIAGVTALVVFNRSTPRGLPIIMLVIIGVWLAYMTTAFLTGHMDTVERSIGSLTDNINASVTNRFRGSPEHLFIVQMRLIMTMILVNLAFLGVLRRLRAGHLDFTMGLLALAPASLIALQSYGGELFLRVYLFALPFVVFFTAALFFPRAPAPNASPSKWITPGIALVSVAFCAGFFLIRYGNERIEYFTRNELAAVEYLYETAEPGAQFLVANNNLPWQYQGYATYKYSIVRRIVRTGDLESLKDYMKAKRYPESYLILTRSQRAWGEMLLGWEPEIWDNFEKMLIETGEFQLVYWNDEARIYTLAPQRSQANP